MYEPHEIEISYRYLKTVVSRLEEPICLIGGWVLTDGEGSYIIPTGTKITESASWSVFGKTYNPTRYTRGLYLANTHDSVTLLDRSGNVIDGYAW